MCGRMRQYQEGRWYSMAEDEVFDPQQIPADIRPLLDRLFRLRADPNWPQGLGSLSEVQHDTAVDIMRRGNHSSRGASKMKGTTTPKRCTPPA
jgi:hypothetical protein